MTFHLRSLLTVIIASLLLFVGCGNDAPARPDASINRGPTLVVTRFGDGTASAVAHRRIFVVDHVGHEAEGVTHTIHILPVE